MMASRVVLIGSRRRGDLYFIRPSIKADLDRFQHAGQPVEK